MPDSSQNPVVEMLRRIHSDMVERMRRGTLKYQNDIATLHKHLALTREINDLHLTGLTYNTIGIIELETGHFENAEKYLMDGYLLLHDSDDAHVKGRLQNNLGEVYRRIGRLEEAALAYATARNLFESIGDMRGIITTEINLGLTFLARGWADQAEMHFQHALALINKNPWDYVESKIEACNGMAEVSIARQDQTAAWRYVEESERLARERGFKLWMAYTYLTKAHIVENDPERHGEGSQYYDRARELLKVNGSPVLLARTLYREARYQQQHEDYAEARQLAQEALALFEEMELHGEVRLAQELLTAHV